MMEQQFKPYARKNSNENAPASKLCVRQTRTVGRVNVEYLKSPLKEGQSTTGGSKANEAECDMKIRRDVEVEDEPMIFNFPTTTTSYNFRPSIFVQKRPKKEAEDPLKIDKVDFSSPSLQSVSNYTSDSSETAAIVDVKLLRSATGAQIIKTSFKCSLCRQKFASESVLSFHEKTHLKDKYNCTFCSKSFTDKSDFIIHLSKHMGVAPPNLCSVCGLAFEEKKTLERHKKTHIVNHSCTVCQQTFATKRSLSRHKRVHLVIVTDKVLDSCDLCHKKFNSLKCLQTHRKKIH